MLNSLRLVRVQPAITLLSPPSPSNIAGNRFRQALAGTRNISLSWDNMAQAHSPYAEFGDTISSMGKEYATRCGDEGFGGIYGMNNKCWKDDDEEHLGLANANAPPDHEGRDKGTEVKYKEEDENQKKVAT